MHNFYKKGDETESWESSIDNDGDPKIKYPLKFKESLDSISLDIPEVKIKKPKNKNKVLTRVIDISKKNKSSKGLF